jgi:hypothetical protein
MAACTSVRALPTLQLSRAATSGAPLTSHSPGPAEIAYEKGVSFAITEARNARSEVPRAKFGSIYSRLNS